MMFAYEYLKDTVEFNDDVIPVLIIENKKTFRQTLRSFYDDTIEEYFVFSQDFKPFDFDKRGFFISNVLDLNFQNKKLTTKINSVMQQTAINEYSSELSVIQMQLINLFDKLNQDYDFEYDTDFEIDFSSIIKLLPFNIDTATCDLSQLLISYILLLNKYLKFDLVVLHSIYDYFDYDEIEKIYNTLKPYHINILVITSSKPEHFSEFEELYIIDSDLCVIDTFEN